MKKASEDVFRRMGLTMTEAFELFLRRVIVEERIPFDVVALDAKTLARIDERSGRKNPVTGSHRNEVRRMPRPRGGGG
jgi:addiction module RelB/DinJ family antitoxin